MARKPTNEPTQGSNGLYRRDIGWKPNGEGGHSQHRFYLGRDRGDAIIRGLHLERCWEGVERRWERLRTKARDRVNDREAGCGWDHPSASAWPNDSESIALVASDRPVWDATTLAIAQSVAKGDAVVRLVTPPRWYGGDVPGAGWSEHPGQLADWLRELRLDFPHLRLELASEARQRRADEYEVERVEAAHRVVEEVVPTTGQTLHQAIDAYVTWLEGEHVVPGSNPPVPSQHGVNLINLAKRTKAHQAEMPLDKLGLAELESMVRYWVARPPSQKKRPISVETARDHVRIIKLFVNWLHRSPAWRWRKPADWVDNFRVRIKETAEEISRKASPEQVPTYSVEELVTLYRHATQWERSLMLLALNCGFGRAEIEGLVMGEIHLDRPHGYYDVTGSWIKRMRGKTVVYGEWSLWPETAEAVRWFIERRTEARAKCPHLVVKRTGRPLAELTAGNNRSQEMPNAWARLTERIRESQPTFRKLSFNKLRKTAGNLVRMASDGETAYVFISHGTPCKIDSLLDLYTNKDFRKVFAAIDKVRQQLAPMFDQLQE